jgi:hypothetical protein
MVMKRIILAHLVFILALSSSIAQQVSDGYIWVAVSDSSALPTSTNRTDNTELNAIFEKYEVTDYFYRFNYPFWGGDDSLIHLQVYEIHYDNISDDENQNQYSEARFFSELLNTGLFYHVFNFPYEENGYLLAYFIDSSAMPISNTRSANDDVNMVLEEYDISSYEINPLPIRYIQNCIIISCSCNIIDLCVRLSELDAIFTKFEIGSFGYPTVSIAEYKQKKINIYPNPFSGYIHIDYDDIRSIEIFNTIGILLYSQHDRYFNQIDLSFLPVGLYILKSQTINNEIFYNKIMKGGK